MAVALLVAIIQAPAHAADEDGAMSMAALGGLSLEQLADLPVTTASRRSQKLSQVPAAIYVITAEDIRRAGARSLPEALRLAPNLEVARINSFIWTITARGFNSPESANKLLVLINGRSVYSPLAGTVFWDAIDVPVDNIARIEVISGPGGSLWGANAVNGVVDVITKTTDDEQGLFADVGGGSLDRDATLRFGGRIDDNTGFDITATGFDRGPADKATPSDITGDAWRGGQISGRIDRRAGNDHYFLYALAYNNGSYDSPFKIAGTNLWGSSAGLKWDRMLGDGAQLSLHGTFSHDVRSTPYLHEFLDAYDAEAQYNFAPMGAHRLIMGGEFKLWNERLLSGSVFGFLQPSASPALGNLFVEDQIALDRQFTLTLGFKGEYNNFSGFDYLPNIRLAWQPDGDTLLWGAVSRAVRTPSRIDRELQAPGLLAPAPDFGSEELVAYQLGYRGQIGDDLNLSVSLYYNDYDDLRSDEYTNGGLPVILSNGLAGHSYGVEAWGKYAVRDWWRLSFGAEWMHRAFHNKTAAVDLSGGQSLGQDPGWQMQLRSEMNLNDALEFDIGLRAVGKVTQLTAVRPTELVPSYVEADLHLGWRLSDRLELSLYGYNLLHDRHLEANDPSSYPVRYIPRSVLVSLTTRL